MSVPNSLKTLGDILNSLPPQQQESTISLYQYRPLDSNDIRVMDLLPGTAQDEITIKIRHISMQDPLDSQFTALSYTWGDPKSTQTISCSNDEGQLVVTTECFSALHRLRLTDTTTTLWVDAICINQSDIPERNHQVTLMGKIYRMSSKVAIYLGTESFDSKLGITYIIAHHARTLLMGNMSLEQMKAIRNLFTRPWFHRVWVIQEARNARKAEVICGDDIFSWAAILALPWNEPYFPESSLGQQPYVALPPSTYWRREKYAYMGDVLSPVILLQHLMRGRSCLATDARDKVFALLPLFKDSDDALAEADLLPNYTYSFEMVCMTVAKYLLKDIGWGLLYAIEGGSKLDLPSWCPDWSIQPTTPLLYAMWRLRELTTFPDSYPDIQHAPVILPNNILQVHAYRHATITSTSTPCDISSPDWPETVFLTWYDFIITSLSPNESHLPQNLLSKETQALLTKASAFMDSSERDNFFAISEVSRLESMNAYRGEKRNNNQADKECQDRIRQRCMGQNMFAVEIDGVPGIGLGPVEMEEGDVVVCGERGGLVVLRRRGMRDGDQDRVYWAVVGKCEIMGFWDDTEKYLKGREEGSLEEFLLV